MAKAPAAGRNTLEPRIELSGRRFLMFELDAMAYDYEQRHDDVIRLTLGKSELPPDDVVTEEMVASLRDVDRSSLVFPAGLPALRERIAAEYRARHDVAVDPTNVVVSVGTSGLYRNVFQLLAGPGDEVLVPRPYYPLYTISALLAGATVRHYRIDPDSVAVDHDSLAANLTDRTRIVVVNSPGNPLGNVLGRADLEAIDAAIDGGALLVSDEMYLNTCFDDVPVSVVELDAPRSPVVVTGGFSKAHRMYSRRVGYAIVPDALVEPLTVIQDHTLLTTDPVPQFGAIAALDRPDGVAELVDAYRRRRDHTLERFADVDLVDAVGSRGGFYLTLECSRYLAARGIGNSLALARRVMEQTHVATVPGSDFGLEQTLRLSFTSAHYEEGIDRLAAFFAS